MSRYGSAVTRSSQDSRSSATRRPGTMRYILVVAALLLCSLSIEAARRRPIVKPCSASPSLPGTIAFVSERDGNSEIYLINMDGTGLTRMTDHPAHDADPAWSPDGERIAFASSRAGNSDIYLMDADGSNLVRLTESGSSSEPSWSADGKKIAFSGRRGGENGIFVMSIDGDRANPTRVGFDRGWIDDPAWSPDGERIAFVSDWRMFDFVYDLYVMDPDGSRITPLIEGPFPTGDLQFYFQPAWSPGGGKIAVVVCGYAWDNCYPASSIAIAKADGSELTTLVQTGGFAGPAWSPDGSTIAYTSQTCRGCTEELRYVSVDGSESGVIFANGHDPSWRP